jgi:hypothetical protein
MSKNTNKKYNLLALLLIYKLKIKKNSKEIIKIYLPLYIFLNFGIDYNNN